MQTGEKLRADFKFISEFQTKVITSKYCHTRNNVKESFNEAIERIADNVNKYDTNKFLEMRNKTVQYISNAEFSPAGGIWRAAGNSHRKISYVNCTTQEPVKDSIEDIFQSIAWWSRIASYGQGNGIDISGLRPRGTDVHNCAKSSTGAVSFLTCYDASMQVIGAENRRGATKPDIWYSHPDSQEYTTCKKDITKLTSQNISIKVDDDFMRAVENDTEIEQKWERRNGNIYVGNRLYNTDEGPDMKISRNTKARELFDRIATAAWETGEPGIEFWETSEKYSNSNAHPDTRFHIVSTNGCSEQKLDSWNTCILASINFAKMPSYKTGEWKSWLTEKSSFGIRFLDNVVEAEFQENRSPHPIQKQKLREMTRIGLGFTGLADWFIQNSIVYGSEESIKITDELMKVFAESSYRTSIELGKERGNFSAFSPDWYTKSPFIQRLCEQTNLKLSEFTHMRHVCLLSVAPTGTLSYVVGAGGSGCEPIPAPWMYRKERSTTGEYVEHYIFSDTVINALNSKGLEINKENAEELIKSPEWVFAIYDKDESRLVNALNKIDLMAVFYKYIDSGVSVTYNMPKTSTIEEVKQIYMKAWKSGLKSVTVYRDGSRGGVINMASSRDNGKISKHDAVKRPTVLECDIHSLQVRGERWVVLVGKLDNEPYEVFCALEKTDGVDLSHLGTHGTIRKNKRGSYSLINGDAKEYNIQECFGNKDEESALTRAHSLALRHGVDIKYVVEQLEKSEGDITSFSKAIARVLKKYIPDGTKVSGESCPQCKSSNMARQSGCVTCVDCLWSKC